MSQKSVSNELELFRQYLRSESNEDAKTPLLHPLFQNSQEVRGVGSEEVRRSESEEVRRAGSEEVRK